MMGILVKSVKWWRYVFQSFFSPLPHRYQFWLKVVFRIWLELFHHEMPDAVGRSQLKKPKQKWRNRAYQTEGQKQRNHKKTPSFPLSLCGDISKTLVSSLRLAIFLFWNGYIMHSYTCLWIKERHIRLVVDLSFLKPRNVFPGHSCPDGHLESIGQSHVTRPHLSQREACCVGDTLYHSFPITEGKSLLDE